MRVLGIEGTAWAASAALYDSDSETVTIETEAYTPESGGIHPREAAEHMAEHLPQVTARVLESADSVDAVAFSRGPGLGPCLRLVGTTARALAQRLAVPLVGVNHMVAHLEIGRHYSGFDDPICLNASGANAHVLAFQNGRYRVLGETMDTGVGNAIDKFTRHVGWSHPGGPKVEQQATDGEYFELPYVVKGMDFSFAGISSAANEAYDAGEPVANICYGLQETVFAMLTEVSERALSLTGRTQLVLGGGVGQNARLQEMLTEMCAQRGASFFAPEDRFLRDNAGMIAVLGAKMYAAGETITIEESSIDSDFRPDEVHVTWRENGHTRSNSVGEDSGGDSESATRKGDDSETVVLRGAEATVTIEPEQVQKRRNPRTYRHPTLDSRLRTERVRAEARLTNAARRAGVTTPLLYDIDLQETTICFQRVGDGELRDGVTEARIRELARSLAALHQAGFVHGDPTTRNVRIQRDSHELFLIDFGLGYYTTSPEDHAMDLHILGRSLDGTEDNAEALMRAVRETYREYGDDAVLSRLDEIEGRGRYQ